MENALERGVNIRICYEIEDNSYNSQSNNRSLNSEGIVNNLICTSYNLEMKSNLF
ncbi:hypothetical protein NE172_11460 [Clostridium botulinum]|uniref:hypothetical protein n=1 Tax=Clostridium botulinum TaxID=1491 RepID=UPI0001AAD853|nr:hypothetical protein [Clostridium botulinum]EES49355.1 hypothetical protein CLO_1688 [Clostridium botulinum E1 str. 'BoNT E Beluga']MBY6762912.1 hypothetical protein [Clostridium botulinum]MBY6921753.1 hypothetical protein [Clostridium botulinum]MCR1131576.1 hypothetical protein [Clostridium botulinum]HBZ6638313.1 hypothetical protein [Clostridium botulinum]